MCLTISIPSKYGRSLPGATKKCMTPLIATEDIVCYKVLKQYKNCRKKIYETPYQDFKVKLGAHYYQEGKKFQIKKISASYYSGPALEIEEGLHSWQNLSKAKESVGYSSYFYIKVIVKCTIPKGSEYYIGINEDYCSDNLIYGTRIIKSY